MKRHVFMFQPRFARLVESGAKLTTIRPKRKRVVRIGDVIDAREWLGKPYRSKQRKLREGVIVGVRDIFMDRFKGRPYVFLGTAEVNSRMRICPGYDVEKIAVNDGFRDIMEMFEWFERTHGLPFTGTHYTWKK